MVSRLKSKVTQKLQKLFWVYLTNNFEINDASDFKMTEVARECKFFRITLENHSRVRDFRGEDRVLEYKKKLARKEIGFFVECDGKTVGSIWATLNAGPAPSVARAHIRLMPKEALIHDIVTGEKSRGMGVGPFMVGRIACALLNDYGVSKIIIDVNTKNKSSLRMMEKAGLRVRQQVFSVSALGTLALEKVLKQYA